MIPIFLSRPNPFTYEQAVFLEFLVEKLNVAQMKNITLYHLNNFLIILDLPYTMLSIVPSISSMPLSMSSSWIDIFVPLIVTRVSGRDATTVVSE